MITEKGAVMIPLADILRDLRKEKGLTQRKLAERVWVDPSTIALYEMGDRSPSLEVLVRLARVLGVTTDYLLGVSSQRNYYLDVTGLTQKEIASLNLIIENYREK